MIQKCGPTLGGYEFELTARAGDTEEFTTKIRQAIPLNEKQCEETQNDLVKIINEYRVSQGLKALQINSKLQQAANIRAKEIVESFSHTRPDGRRFDTVFTDVGILHNTSGGENIAESTGKVNNPQESAQMVFDKWKASPGHNRNMLTTASTHVAFGIVATEEGVFAVTLFVNNPDK